MKNFLLKLTGGFIITLVLTILYYFYIWGFELISPQVSFINVFLSIGIMLILGGILVTMVAVGFFLIFFTHEILEK
jgi:hypothetical protein